MISNEQYEKLWQIFKQLGSAALSMNHYDLAEQTQIKEPEIWKEFLLMPEVSDWIRSENQVITQTEIRKLANQASGSRSVGQAQLIGALTKLTDDGATKEGPVFIYSYIPLNADQEQAPNVQVLNKDPFLKGDV